MNEKLIERKLRTRIEGLGGLCIKLLPWSFTGLPDRICLLPGGRIYFVETKSTGDTQSPRQVWVAKQLMRLGFQVWIMDRQEVLNQFLEHIKPTT
jgi:hypothetical protein